MTVQFGEGYRSREGRMGYLLRQVVHAFHSAMEDALRPHRLSSPQYGALYVLEQEPGLSSADLARAMGVTPQAASLLVTGMERDGLLRRRPHSSHGRILELHPTAEGRRRYRAAEPTIAALEADLGAGLGPRQLAAIRSWMVAATQRLGSR